MPESPSSSSSFIDTIVHILQPIRSLNWTRYLGLITAALSLPLRLAWIPLSRLLALVTTLLAPAGYVLAYLGSWAAAVARFLVSLEVRFQPSYMCAKKLTRSSPCTHSYVPKSPPGSRQLTPRAA